MSLEEKKISSRLFNLLLLSSLLLLLLLLRLNLPWFSL